MKIKILSIILALTATVMAFSPESTAKKPAEKKTDDYAGFIAKKGLIKKEGFVKIYKKGKDVYLEIPDSVIGRKVMINSSVRQSSSPFLSEGTNVSGKQSTYQIEKTDSLVLFLAPAPSICVKDGDESISRAIKKSQAQAIVYAFPIRYRNTDSTAVVIKASKLFSPSDKKVIDFRAKEFNGNLIYDSECKADMTQLKSIKAYSKSVGVVQEASYKLTVVVGFFLSSDKKAFSGDFLSTMTLLGNSDMPKRITDDRIGTDKISFTSFGSSQQSKTEYCAARWDLRKGRKITVYLDTLINPAWRAAVKEGIEAWNPAFEKIGLGKVIEVRDFPDGSGFSAEDPMISTVRYSPGERESLYGNIHTDNTTGEILSINISLPGNYLNGIRKASAYTISDVDTRYQDYNLSTGAVCDVIRAQVMGLFGKCLGIGANYAGSMAYSPEQLRSPAFTKAHGITGSVTDDVLFNIMARPGDKEKGVVTITDRIGPYDYYAIEWLYRQFPKGKDEEAALDSLIRSKKNIPEYQYVPKQKGNPDPRAVAYDLGNDPFASFEAGLSHLKFTAANADKWLDHDYIPEDYRNLFIEWVWLKQCNYIYSLSSLVGGIYENDIRTGNGLPHFAPVPVTDQKKAINTIMDAFRDMSWMDKNRKLLDISGMYSSVDQITNANAFSQSGLISRLDNVAMANRVAGSSYSPEEYLTDVQNSIMKNVRKGKLKAQEDVSITRYLFWLIQNSPVMTANYKEATSAGGKSSLAENLTPAISDVPEVYTADLGNLCYTSLEKARKILSYGRSVSKDAYAKGKLDYLISIAEDGLGTDKK
ncbi:MAG: zinc-dependent metalloprotease [Bacteroidales bacterium]|jgi:hypothetical protein|nr:zinc-dependent metalloprotease [Bacteroidales bacterium]MCI1784741.1 zinc-dependent metalloprotease [Bacteroidales bacterium]